MTKLTCTLSHTTLNENEAAAANNNNLMPYDISGSEIDIKSLTRAPGSQDGSKQGKKKTRTKGSNKTSASSNKSTAEAPKTNADTSENVEDFTVGDQLVENSKQDNGSESGTGLPEVVPENERNSAVKSVSSENDESSKGGKVKPTNANSGSQKVKASK